MKKRLFGIIFSFIFLSFITSNDVFAAITGSFANSSVSWGQENSFTITGIPDKEVDYELIFYNKSENREISKIKVETYFKDNKNKCDIDHKDEDQISNDTKCEFDNNSRTYSISGVVATDDPDFPPSTEDRTLEIRFEGEDGMSPFSFVVKAAPKAITRLEIDNPNAELKKGMTRTIRGQGIKFQNFYGDDIDQIPIRFGRSTRGGEYNFIYLRKDGNGCKVDVIDVDGLKLSTSGTCGDYDRDGLYIFTLPFSVDNLPKWMTGSSDSWNDTDSNIVINIKYGEYADDHFFSTSPATQQQVTLTLGPLVQGEVDFEVTVEPTPPLKPGDGFDLIVTPKPGKEENFQYSREYSYTIEGDSTSYAETKTCKPNERCSLDGLKVPEGWGQETITVVVQCHTGRGCDNNPSNKVSKNIDISGIDVTPPPTPTPTPARPPCKTGISFGTDLTSNTTADDPNLIDQCTEFDSALGIIPIDVKGFVEKLFAFILGIAGGIALIILIYSGYQIMTSQGNAEKLQASKDRITSAFIGIVFIIFSLVILEVIGVDILNVPGFSG